MKNGKQIRFIQIDNHYLKKCLKITKRKIQEMFKKESTKKWEFKKGFLLVSKSF